MGPEPVVVITLKEIYEMLVRVASKVEIVLEQHNGTREDVVDLQKVDADQENRIRALERARWPLPALAVLLSIAAVVLTLIKMTQGG